MPLHACGSARLTMWVAPLGRRLLAMRIAEAVGSVSGARKLFGAGDCCLKAVGVRRVTEARELAQECKRDLSYGAIALLRDDELGDAGVLRRGVVHLVAIDEEDHVGILLDRPAFAEIR